MSSLNISIDNNNNNNNNSKCIYKDKNTWIELTESLLESYLLPCINFMKASNVGAISSFYGTTRDYFQDLKVKTLYYECYIPKTMYELKKICQQIRQKWNIINICIFHRINTNVNIEECSVIIYISSSHRKDSLEATTYAINTLKATVPIWKKEFYDNNDTNNTWKQNKEWDKNKVVLN